MSTTAVNHDNAYRASVRSASSASAVAAGSTTQPYHDNAYRASVRSAREAASSASQQSASATSIPAITTPPATTQTPVAYSTQSPVPITSQSPVAVTSRGPAPVTTQAAPVTSQVPVATSNSPSNAAPVGSQPIATSVQPAATQPATTQPVAQQQVTTQPAATQPVASQPAGTQSAAAQQPAAQPAQSSVNSDSPAAVSKPTTPPPLPVASSAANPDPATSNVAPAIVAQSTAPVVSDAVAQPSTNAQVGVGSSSGPTPAAAATSAGTAPAAEAVQSSSTGSSGGVSSADATAAAAVVSSTQGPSSAVSDQANPTASSGRSGSRDSGSGTLTQSGQVTAMTSASADSAILQEVAQPSSEASSRTLVAGVVLSTATINGQTTLLTLTPTTINGQLTLVNSETAPIPSSLSSSATKDQWPSTATEDHWPTTEPSTFVTSTTPVGAAATDDAAKASSTAATNTPSSPYSSSVSSTSPLSTAAAAFPDIPSSTMSTPAKVGVTFGCLFFLTLLVFCAFYVRRRRRAGHERLAAAFPTRSNPFGSSGPSNPQYSTLSEPAMREVSGAFAAPAYRRSRGPSNASSPRSSVFSTTSETPFLGNKSETKQGPWWRRGIPGRTAQPPDTPSVIEEGAADTAYSPGIPAMPYSDRTHTLFSPFRDDEASSAYSPTSPRPLSQTSANFFSPVSSQDDYGLLGPFSNFSPAVLTLLSGPYAPLSGSSPTTSHATRSAAPQLDVFRFSPERIDPPSFHEAHYGASGPRVLAGASPEMRHLITGPYEAVAPAPTELDARELPAFPLEMGGGRSSKGSSAHRHSPLASEWVSIDLTPQKTPTPDLGFRSGALFDEEEGGEASERPLSTRDPSMIDVMRSPTTPALQRLRRQARGLMSTHRIRRSAHAAGISSSNTSGSGKSSLKGSSLRGSIQSGMSGPKEKEKDVAIQSAAVGISAATSPPVTGRKEMRELRKELANGLGIFGVGFGGSKSRKKIGERTTPPITGGKGWINDGWTDIPL